MTSPGPGRLSRRGFLLGAAGSAAVGAVAGAGVATAVAADAAPRPARTGPPPLEFYGPHQTGVVSAPREFALTAAFRCVSPDRTGLVETLKALTTTAGQLVGGRTYVPREKWAPPRDTGVLGADEPVESAVTVAVGASLFDERYGLAGTRPRELRAMPRLANDRLDPARVHGDLLLTVQSDRPDVLAHSLRQLMRATRSGLVLRWVVDGFSRPDPHQQAGTTRNRNLMGFKDGTANPDAGDAALMDRLVWVQAGDREPAWAVGGTYEAVRVIRMFVEQWDRAPLGEQEGIIGRHKVSGAPLGRRREEADPDLSADPDGERIPLDAHIRLANPRTPHDMDTQILRRGFNFTRGFDGAGQLDQGLAFVSYQRRLAQFLAVQARLKGEPLEEYTQVEGGGFYFVLPGVHDPSDWLGRSLLSPLTPSAGWCLS